MVQTLHIFYRTMSKRKISSRDSIDRVVKRRRHVAFSALPIFCQPPIQDCISKYLRNDDLHNFLMVANRSYYKKYSDQLMNLGRVQFVLAKGLFRDVCLENVEVTGSFLHDLYHNQEHLPKLPKVTGTIPANGEVTSNQLIVKIKEYFPDKLNEEQVYVYVSSTMFNELRLSNIICPGVTISLNLDDHRVIIVDWNEFIEKFADKSTMTKNDLAKWTENENNITFVFMLSDKFRYTSEAMWIDLLTYRQQINRHRLQNWMFMYNCIYQSDKFYRFNGTRTREMCFKTYGSGTFCCNKHFTSWVKYNAKKINWIEFQNRFGNIAFYEKNRRNQDNYRFLDEYRHVGSSRIRVSTEMCEIMEHFQMFYKSRVSKILRVDATYENHLRLWKQRLHRILSDYETIVPSIANVGVCVYGQIDNHVDGIVTDSCVLINKQLIYPRQYNLQKYRFQHTTHRF